jgi:hypothetical protein
MEFKLMVVAGLTIFCIMAWVKTQSSKKSG